MWSTEWGCCIFWKKILHRFGGDGVASVCVLKIGGGEGGEFHIYFVMYAKNQMFCNLRDCES